MKKIETSIIIKATPDVIWQMLMNFEKYPTWNPFIRAISGDPIPGNKLTVTLQPPEFSAMTIKPILKVCTPAKELRWKGQLFIPGLFDGEHYFKLDSSGNGYTQFVHGEKFSGVLVWLMGGVLKKTKRGFESMNQSLKTVCET